MTVWEGIGGSTERKLAADPTLAAAVTRFIECPGVLPVDVRVSESGGADPHMRGPAISTAVMLHDYKVWKDARCDQERC